MPKLPKFPGVRDGYRLAFDLRSKAFTCGNRVQLREGDARSSDSPREEDGFEPSVPRSRERTGRTTPFGWADGHGK